MPMLQQLCIMKLTSSQIGTVTAARRACLLEVRNDSTLKMEQAAVPQQVCPEHLSAGAGRCAGWCAGSRASLAMLHPRLHDLRLEWEVDCLPALGSLSNSCAAYARAQVEPYQWLPIPSQNSPSTVCSPLSA